MASLGTSALIIGYHQDPNETAHILSLDGTFVPIDIWTKMSQIVYEIRWSKKYQSYDQWRDSYMERCTSQGIEVYSGKGLYSTLLPEDMQWMMKLGNSTIQIINGILVAGILESKTTTGTNSSIGMNIYRTYGAEETVSWLNASYRMLNIYLIYKGNTLGFSHILLSEEQDDQIDKIKQLVTKRDDLRTNVEIIPDLITRIRTESAITQELDNVREQISVIVMNPTSLDLTYHIRGIMDSDLILYAKRYRLDPNCTNDAICLQIDPFSEIVPISREEIDEYPTKDIHLSEKITLRGRGSTINLDFYTGTILYTPLGSNKTYRFSMGVFPRVSFILLSKEIQNNSEVQMRIPIDRLYTTPNQLRMMIESGARGNATNGIQIGAIIGQMSYGGGRIPRMLDSSQSATTATLDSSSNEFIQNTGSRSMPCYEFGENTPKSRGFIANSYLQGMTPSEYMSSHVASRENLTSNTDLTPRTGYFERRVRTFTENLRITRGNNMQVVTNERDIIVMWDYLMDPSKLFAIDKHTTFMDIGYERSRMNISTTSKAIYIHIPYRETIREYLSLDNKLQSIIEGIQDVDIILSCDSRIEVKHTDFYQYLRDVVTKNSSNQNRNVVVITLSTDIPLKQRESWFFSLIEYDNIIVIPLSNRYRPDLEKIQSMLRLPVQQAIDVFTANISEISYDIKSGSIIPLRTLYQMLILGTQYTSFPMMIIPSIDSYELISKYSLLETLILSHPTKQL